MNDSRPVRSLRDGAFVGAIWLFALFAPPMIADPSARLGASFWLVVVVAVAFVTYDAVQAWRRGSRAPLVLKCLVPAALLALSWLCYSAGVWAAVLAVLRAGA